MDLTVLFLTFTIQLFILVDPVAGVAVFLAITPGKSVEERRRMAFRGCMVAFIVVAFFLLLGPVIFGYFGIGAPAVRICGGILLFGIALEMLYGRRFTGTGTSPREERLAGEKEDISITPLAIPLLAGPGAITTALIFAEHSENLLSLFSLLVGCAVVFGLSFLFFYRAEILLRVLGNLGMTILTRILGLVLAFLSVQYVLDGFRAAFLM
jgi:multiple antibiotic resistance protein